MDEKYHFNYWTVGIIIAIAAIVFGIFALYDSGSSSVGPELMPAGASASIETVKPVDQEKLAGEYKASADKILAEYLSATATKPGDLAALSDTAKAELLELTLPAQYKDRHLSEVILLGEISALSQSGKGSEAQAKYAELKALISQ